MRTKRGCSYLCKNETRGKKVRGRGGEGEDGKEGATASARMGV